MWYIVSGGTGTKRELTIMVYNLARTALEWCAAAILVFSLWPSKAERHRGTLKLAAAPPRSFRAATAASDRPAAVGLPPAVPKSAARRSHTAETSDGPPAAPRHGDAARRRHSDAEESEMRVVTPRSPPAAPRFHARSGSRRSSEVGGCEEERAASTSTSPAGDGPSPAHVGPDSPSPYAASPRSARAAPPEVHNAFDAQSFHFPMSPRQRGDDEVLAASWPAHAVREADFVPSGGLHPSGLPPLRLSLSPAHANGATEFRLSLAPTGSRGGEPSFAEAPHRGRFPMGPGELGAQAHATERSPDKGPRKICVYRPFVASSCLVQPREPPPAPSAEFIARVQRRMLACSSSS